MGSLVTSSEANGELVLGLGGSSGRRARSKYAEPSRSESIRLPDELQWWRPKRACSSSWRAPPAKPGAAGDHEARQSGGVGSVWTECSRGSATAVGWADPYLELPLHPLEHVQAPLGACHDAAVEAVLRGSDESGGNRVGRAS